MNDHIVIVTGPNGRGEYTVYGPTDKAGAKEIFTAIAGDWPREKGWPKTGYARHASGTEVRISRIKIWMDPR